MHTTRPKTNLPPIQEITGRPAKLINNGFGNFVFPASGVVTLKISGDLLVVSSKGFFDKHESWTRLQNIDCVELVESPLWEVLLLGIPTLIAAGWIILAGGFNGLGSFLLFMGLACVGLFIPYRRRYLSIYSQRNVIPVFLTKPPEMYQQFAANVLTIARRLNAPQRSTGQPTGNGQIPNSGGYTNGRVGHTSGHAGATSGRVSNGRLLPPPGASTYTANGAGVPGAGAAHLVNAHGMNPHTTIQ